MGALSVNDLSLYLPSGYHKTAHPPARTDFRGLGRKHAYLRGGASLSVADARKF